MPEPVVANPRWFERKPWKDLFEIVSGIFQGLLLVYLGLLLVEALRPGTVTKFLRINWLLLAVVVTGVASVLTTRPQEEPERLLRRKDYILVGALALGAGFILWFKLDDLGWIQWPISILGGLLIGLVSLSVLMPEKPVADVVPPKTIPKISEKPKPAGPPKKPTAAQIVDPFRPVPPAPPKGSPIDVEAAKVGPAQWRFACPKCGSIGRTGNLGKILTCPKCRTRVIAR